MSDALFRWNGFACRTPRVGPRIALRQTSAYHDGLLFLSCKSLSVAVIMFGCCLCSDSAQMSVACSHSQTIRSYSSNSHLLIRMSSAWKAAAWKWKEGWMREGESECALSPIKDRGPKNGQMPAYRDPRAVPMVCAKCVFNPKLYMSSSPCHELLWLPSSALQNRVCVCVSRITVIVCVCVRIRSRMRRIWCARLAWI